MNVCRLTSCKTKHLAVNKRQIRCVSVSAQRYGQYPSQTTRHLHVMRVPDLSAQVAVSANLRTGCADKSIPKAEKNLCILSWYSFEPSNSWISPDSCPVTSEMFIDGSSQSID